MSSPLQMLLPRKPKPPDLPRVNFGRWHTVELPFYYNQREDTLAIRYPFPEEFITISLLDGIEVLADPDTGEAIELHIRNLQRNLLPKYPEIAAAWQQVKPSPIALRRMENTPFIHAFLEHMARLAYDRERQLDPARL